MQDPNKPTPLQIEVRLRAAHTTPDTSQPGPVAKVIAAVFAVAFLIAALFLSMFIVAGLAVVAAVAGAWFWWRTRRLRRELRAALDAAEKQMAARREQGSAGQGPSRAEVIDGDYIRTKPAEPPPVRLNQAPQQPTDISLDKQ